MNHHVCLLIPSDRLKVLPRHQHQHQSLCSVRVWTRPIWQHCTLRGVNAPNVMIGPEPLNFWISMALDWPRVHVLHHRVLKLYVLIPVIFILRSHTASFRQFTGNVTTSHTSKLTERIYQYFWKRPVHTWSLYGNLLVNFRKSLYVWKGLLSPCS